MKHSLHALAAITALGLGIFASFTRGDADVQVQGLVLSPDHGRWECRWSLDHIYPETVSFRGNDPLQALTTTRDFASNLIRGSEADGLSVRWQKEGDHGGLTFPMCEEEAVTGRKPIWEIPKAQKSNDPP